MAEIALKDFNYEAFAKDLASQASQVVPQDIQGADKDFVIDIIYRFCMMAADALVKEENSVLNAQSASLIVQFIGEWIFHKSIDLIRANIEMQYREGILQKVAFTVFEIAKKAVENKMPQDQLISLVEAHVKKCFEKAIEDLKERGILSEEKTKDVMSQSNIDAMAEENVAQKQKAIEEERQKENDIINMPDEKILKLASLAVLIKNFNPEKIKNIISKFQKPEREVLLKYLKMPDLEDKLDVGATMKCLEQMKNTLPENIVISYDKAVKKMCKIVKNSSKDEILNIIKNERPSIQDFVSTCFLKDKTPLPAYVADIVSKYIEENVS